MTHSLPIGIVLPGAHRWHRQSVIQYVLDLGMLPILLVQKEEMLEQIPDGAFILQWWDKPTESELQLLSAQINQLCSSWYLLPLDDYISERAAQLSVYASKPCYEIDAAEITFHKHLLRDLWNRYCTAHPELPLQIVDYVVYENGKQSKSSAGFEQNSSAFIIKPDAYSGSVGVLRALVKSELGKAVKQCADILKNEACNPEMNGITINQKVLVEVAIPRKQNLAGCAEFTAHYLSFNGEHHLLGIAEKTIHPVTYIETSHTFPSHNFPLQLMTALNNCTSEILDELQVQNTLSNWEFIITPDHKLAMVEGQLRPSGDHVMELIENACLVSPYTLLLQALANGQLSLHDASPKLTSIIYWPKPSIVLNHVLEIAVPVSLPTGVHLQIDETALKDALNWHGPISWYDRHIAIISTAVNAAQALQQIQETLSGCRLEGTKNGIAATATLIAE